MPLRTLIVDDEPDARENLRIMLEDTCPEVEVAALASGAEHARELIALHHPQALFLDIKMPGGMDGIETPTPADNLQGEIA